MGRIGDMLMRRLGPWPTVLTDDELDGVRFGKTPGWPRMSPNCYCLGDEFLTKAHGPVRIAELHPDGVALVGVFDGIHLAFCPYGDLGEL